MFEIGDRVRIKNSLFFNEAVGTITIYTCDTARYVVIDDGPTLNFRIKDLELIKTPAQDSYMELFL